MSSLYFMALLALAPLPSFAAGTPHTGASYAVTTTPNLPPPALAQQKNESKDSPFAKLCAMYDNGAMPDANSLIGWHSGRLFKASAPHTAVSVLLTADWVKPSPESGDSALRIRRQENDSPRYYENLPADRRQDVEDSLPETNRQPRTYLGRNCFYVLNANGERDDRMFIRHLGNYIIFKGFVKNSREEYYGYALKQPL